MELLGKNLDGIYGNRILLEGKLIPALIKLKDGRISDIVYREKDSPVLITDETYLDAQDLVVMPAAFDSHVHVNDPGRTSWEGFESATRAALAGGIATIIDMPLNSIPPTTTLDNLNVKLATAKGKCYTDVGFWGGVVPDNVNSLRPMVEKGVIGFKCFLIHSGVDEFPCVNEGQVNKALEQLNGTDAVLAFHAEVDLENNNILDSQNDPRLYASFLESRPDDMELEAIKLVDRQMRKHRNVRCHIVHLSTAKALPILAKLKQDGYQLTVETCPHYLTLSPDEIAENQTQFKCCPPIRNTANQDQLWKGLKNGIIDMIVSDHSPCTSDLKMPGKKDFMEAWGGISSIQFGLSIIWSQAKEREFTLADLSRWMSSEPVRLAGKSSTKGKIGVDFDADFVIWNDREQFVVETEEIHYKNKLTPYLGQTLTGKVISTILRGTVSYSNGCFSPANGNLLVQ